MLVGGTNFEDWAARNQTASYDFAAAIGEDGSLNERYYRFQSLAKFIQEHGTRIARSRIEQVAYQTTDSLVELTVRRHPDGTRYLFVRTEEHSRRHQGQLIIDNGQLTVDFNLEPFGSQVYVINGQSVMDKGQWLPYEVEHTGKPQPHQMLQPLAFSQSRSLVTQASHYTAIPSSGKDDVATVDALGHYRRYPILYKVRTSVKRGGTLTIERVGKNQMNRSEADVVLAFADNKPLSIAAETDTTVSFSVPRGTRALTFIYDSRGLHHHTNQAVEQHWHIGPAYVTLDGQPMKLAFSEATLPTYIAKLTTPLSKRRGDGGEAPLWLIPLPNFEWSVHEISCTLKRIHLSPMI